MASTGKLFYNAVRGMNREQMLSYITMFTEDLELKVILNSFDTMRKAAILDIEMTSTLDECMRSNQSGLFSIYNSRHFHFKIS